jgi:hypothetical protein
MTRAQEAQPEPIRLGLILVVAAIGCGFVAIGLAWYHAGNTDQTWIQNQELISGGVGGLALVLLGVGLLIRDRLVLLPEAGERQRPAPAVADLQTAAATSAPDLALTARGANGTVRPRPLRADRTGHRGATP